MKIYLVQSFEEGIADKSKIDLSRDFVERIYAISKANNLTPTKTWLKWQEHTRINEAMDQSPTFPEFLAWNKLKGGIVGGGEII